MVPRQLPRGMSWLGVNNSITRLADFHQRYRFLLSDIDAISPALCTQVLRYLDLELIVSTTRH